MSAFNKVANVLQKGAVTGLFSVFAWQMYQIGTWLVRTNAMQTMTATQLRRTISSHSSLHYSPIDIFLSFWTGVQCTDYSKNSESRRLESTNQHAEIMEKIAKKVEEESLPHTTDTIPDRYEAEDDSYLKRVPKLNQRWTIKSYTPDSFFVFPMRARRLHNTSGASVHTIQFRFEADKEKDCLIEKSNLWFLE